MSHIPLFLIVDSTVQNVPNVLAAYNPQTGCAGQRVTYTTWPALPATPARDNCQPEKSLHYKIIVFSARRIMWRPLRVDLVVVSTGILKCMCIMIFIICFRGTFHGFSIKSRVICMNYLIHKEDTTHTCSFLYTCGWVYVHVSMIT